MIYCGFANLLNTRNVAREGRDNNSSLSVIKDLVNRVVNVFLTWCIAFIFCVSGVA